MEDAVAGRELALRGVVGVLVAVVCAALLVQNLYLLLWWSSVLTGPDGPCDFAPAACWQPHQPVWWGVTAALTVVGAVSGAMAVRGFRRAGLWWPWLFGAMGPLVAGAFAAGQIS
ncbi:hypothetical protein [Paractinoplanes abujensis]|uniref:Uncharacterized protein n=1 Tax=Paractinoplanes abujensis TaxID=882441 RepID=A0A7W7CQF9_9ACTN|nr:hypothetical protein [Actinoplanes abujensis]MBB4692539.1 hypothetical protein [Actinoplanes abujensis]